MSEFKGFINQRYKKFKVDEYGNKIIIDGKNSFSLDELKDWHESLGMIVPEGMVVIDVDNKKESDALYNCVKHEGIKCLVSESPRGKHFYFRIPTGMKIKNSVHVSIPLGLTEVDYRSGQSTSMIIEFRNGKWCNWLIGPTKDSIDPFTDLDELPFYLFPLKSNIGSFCGMGDGDGRNNTLNSHRTRLVALYGYNQNQINKLFELINNYVFETPLDRKELETLTEFRELDKKTNSERWFDSKGHFLHNEMGEFLIDNMNAYRDESMQTYYFNDQYYSMDDRVLEQKIVEICPQLIERQRNEVIKYIHLAKIKHETQPQTDGNWICCKNCIVDAMTGRVLGFTPDVFLTSQLNVNYDPLAYDQYVDKFLNEVLVDKGDKEQRMIFEEYLGYTIISKDNAFKKMLFMIGPNADNGKSTTLSLVQNLLTQDNYSSMKLSQISENNAHAMVQLVDKLANFDDDADSSLIKGSTMAYLKTIISDENKITINPKFKQPFQKFIKAKFWIASNHILRTEQKGNEWMTRLLILAFNNKFEGKRKTAFLQSHMKDKLKSDSAKSYLLRLAIEGYQRLMNNGAFTESAESQKWVRQYKIENDTVFKFFWTRKYDAKQLDNKTVKALHLDYKNFIEEEDFTYASNLNTFENRLIEYYNGKIRIENIDNERVIKYDDLSELKWIDDEE